MKIIDLLNKIANGEEIPNYVKYYNMLQDKLDTMTVCEENIYYKLDNLEIQINSRVEPIEEKKQYEYEDYLIEELEKYKQTLDKIKEIMKEPRVSGSVLLTLDQIDKIIESKGE